ncbi:MAG: hypothetical protein RL026_1079 [Pseudomonadota bacterium]
MAEGDLRRLALAGYGLLATAALGGLLALWLVAGLLLWLPLVLVHVVLDLLLRRRHAGEAELLRHLDFQRQTLLFAALAFLMASIALWPLVLLLFLDLPLMLAYAAICLWVLWRAWRGVQRV